MKKLITIDDRTEIQVIGKRVELDLILSPLAHLTPLGVEKVWRLFTVTKRHNAKIHIGSTYSFLSSPKDAVTPLEVAEKLREICLIDGARASSKTCDTLYVIRDLEKALGNGSDRFLGATGTSFYSLYLRSPEWHQKRAQALEGSHYTCSECGLAKERTIGLRLNVHHVTYERLGHELPDDLRVLCVNCHNAADVERRQSERV